ncbi:N-acetylglucosamine-6-phosphate deacetylase [Eubacteriales bacterium OttesenSCG-928-M02]|nr:N-acetylglucosamine-6-phosphate deacetylase [Eubacteriales bacterium OttesenSCG-928-M02]
MANVRALKSKRVIDGYRSIADGVVIIRDGKIDAIGPQSYVAIPADAEVTDYGDLVISPGFIDIHIHGHKGVGAQESVEDTLALAEFIAKNGTTSFLPTVNTVDGVRYAYEASEIQKKDGYKGAAIPGSHMEGPFLSPKELPGRPEVDANLIPPSIEKFNEFWEASHGQVKLVDIGIDRPGAFELTRHMRSLGIVVSIAHSKSGYDLMVEAMENGVTHATHLYNVMTGLHHRRPGITGACLTNDMITCELICDGLHVHPAAMDVAIRCKGYDRIAVITDLSMAGLPDGDYERANGSWITVKDGIARMKGSDPSQDNTMSGSCITQEVGVRNIYKVLNYPLEAAVRMASISPAKMMKIDSFTGSLEVGKDADIAIFTDNIEIKETIVKGTTVYKA